LLGEALEAARAIGSAASSPDAAWYRSEYQGAMSWALAALAPYLGPTERDRALREALAAARAIGYEWSRFHALAALIPRLGPTERDQAVREALAAARALDSEQFTRGSALTELAPHLTAPLLGEALEAARAIGDAEYRSGALSALAPRLTELPLAMLSSLWSITLRLSAIRTRRNVLRDLIALVPVLSALGGAEAMAETARAIQDVGRWWP